MEVELKYTVDSRKTADRIWNDPQLKELEEDDSRSSNDFRGTYYDTEDYDLFRHDIAYRLRTEGNKLVASLKWNGKNTGPLHKREELNITLGDARQPKDPDPSVFCESEEGGELLELVGDKKLIEMIQVNVLRRSFRVDIGESIVELSLDDGEILAGGGSDPVCELELELYSGSEEDLVQLGEELQERYRLTPGRVSKFVRGLKLLGVH
ncbi:MAG: CYTH domain-containing protein [Anaerovoracaceae bacterium]|jgi:triphosphatase